MSRRFVRLSSLLVLLLSSEIWALGLGDIRLDSALNEPLRAEIELLSASPDELADLTVALASAETFARYGIDRPFYLQQVEFKVISGPGGSVIQIRSRSPVTEPFLTFLVEATWSSGRLLREYTVLLDPPTYAAPTAQQPPPVTAPRRSTPADSGRIERQPAASPPSSVPAPAQTEPEPQPPVDDRPYATTGGTDFVVERGETLWGVAARMRPDERLTMNQTMLAIYEANPDAFGGNINMLRAGARLRIPSADEIFQIGRGDAQNEVQRQHSAWSGADGYTPPEPAQQPRLTLVPPDDEPVAGDYDESSIYEPPSREDEIVDRIAELEAADVPNQQSLIEIRDNELAALRRELAEIRGEVYEPPPPVEVVDETPVDDALVDEPEEPDLGADLDNLFVDDSEEPFVDDSATVDTEAADAVDAAADEAPAEEQPGDVIRTPQASEASFVERAIDFLTGVWGIIIGALILAGALLLWLMRRGGAENDSGPWETLDADELGPDDLAVGELSATETMQAPTPDEAIVVVEQDSGVHPVLEDTVEAPAAETGDAAASSESFGSLEDTFSSETAVNLDQTDPIAEADFHMAYGLYDQAADLVNGALETDPSDQSLMSKLCEIYFVWGNRDAFVDAATRLKAAVGDGDSAEWDKIVIMGQQIAADDDLFAGAEVVGATKAVDLSFDEGGDAAGALDMDFGAGESGSSDIIDLGEDAQAAEEGVDFNFGDSADEAGGDAPDLDVTAETPTVETSMTEVTAEMPTPTVETPTIEEQFSGFDGGTSELPALDESLGQAISDSGQDSDATAEINLDELDLGGGDLEETELASLDALDETGRNEVLSDTGINEALADVDLTEVTGENPEVDTSATGLVEGLDLSDLEETEGSGIRLAADETGQNPMASAEREQEPTDVGIDDSLLDATGHTQILSDDMAVETAAGLSDDDATMLAPIGDDDDFDFAKTEALPPDAFTGNTDLEETAETPAIAETDVDLDLDDLTAALKVSEIGDTVEQPRDDETVEQPRPAVQEGTAEVPTMSLSPEDMSDDLHEARTMTEVGTKLDLARAYVDMGDPSGARSILEEVLDEGDEGQKQQAQKLLDSLSG